MLRIIQISITLSTEYCSLCHFISPDYFSFCFFIYTPSCVFFFFFCCPWWLDFYSLFIVVFFFCNSLLNASLLGFRSTQNFPDSRHKWKLSFLKLVRYIAADTVSFNIQYSSLLIANTHFWKKRNKCLFFFVGGEIFFLFWQSVSLKKITSFSLTF